MFLFQSILELNTGHFIRSDCQRSTFVINSGRASFWGYVYTVCKWTRNLRTKIRKCDEVVARFPIQNTRVPFPWSFASCVVWEVFETEFRFLRTPYDSFPWFCVQLYFYAYHTQKFALTRATLYESSISTIAQRAEEFRCFTLCETAHTANCRGVDRRKDPHIRT